MEFVKKWYPLLLFGVLAVAGIVYLFVSMKPKSGTGARYLDGRDLMEVGGVEYALINAEALYLYCSFSKVMSNPETCA